MTLLEALILGIVQGLSEFLPISSSGHLILIPWLLGWGASSLTFDVALHIGTTVAVLLYFWREWVAIALGLARGVAWPAARRELPWRMAWMLVVGSVPAAVAGLLFADTIEASIREPAVVAVLLIIFGLGLGVADRVGPRTRPLDQLGLGQALLIGLAQALALAPGVSRSGVTLSAALLLGLDRPAAARFSFLLSMPAIVGAVVFQGLRFLRAGGPAAGEELVFLVGIASSAVVGIAAIGFLLRFLQANSVNVFVGYRVVVGIAVLFLVLT